MRANYDGKRGCFVATSSFDSYSLPVTVSVDFYANTVILGDSEHVKDVVEQCDVALAEDTLLKELIDAIQSSDYSNESLFNELLKFRK